MQSNVVDLKHFILWILLDQISLNIKGSIVIGFFLFLIRLESFTSKIQPFFHEHSLSFSLNHWSCLNMLEASAPEFWFGFRSVNIWHLILQMEVYTRFIMINNTPSIQHTTTVSRNPNIFLVIAAEEMLNRMLKIFQKQSNNLFHISNKLSNNKTWDKTVKISWVMIGYLIR